MKSFAFFIFVSSVLMLNSCSTCYECTEERIIYDANNNPIDTTAVSDEFCTADPEQVKTRENEGSVCKVQ